MKFVIVFVLAAVAVASAEPPRYRFRSQQQQQAPPAAQPAPYPPAAPYPAAGRPSGPLFRLPERQQANPPQTYAAATEASITTTTDSIETTTSRRSGKSSRLTAESDAEAVDTKDSDAEEGANAVPENVYYIYHPNGLLQRVVYTTASDDKGNAQTAQLRYENVEPIRGPIFTYDPTTFQLQPVNVNQLQQPQQ